MRMHLLYGVGFVLCGITWTMACNGPAATQATTTDAQAPADGPDNAFARANPDYKARAGAFYEKEYLGKAWINWLRPSN